MTDISSWKIVLIDDEEDIRDVMTVALSDAGYDVLTAADGVTGLQRCETFSPQIVITDIRMPGLDGLQVLEEIRKTDKDIAVVIFTGYPNLDSAVASMKLDAVDYIKQHYQERVQIPVLAELCGMPARRFSEQFKQVLGLAPQTFVVLVRVHYACLELLRSEAPLAIQLATRGSRSGRFMQ